MLLALLCLLRATPKEPFIPPSLAARRASKAAHQVKLLTIPSGDRAQRVPAGAGGVCGVVWLSPLVLRIGQRWQRGSGGDPAVCA